MPAGFKTACGIHLVRASRKDIRAWSGECPYCDAENARVRDEHTGRVTKTDTEVRQDRLQYQRVKQRKIRKERKPSGGANQTARANRD